MLFIAEFYTCLVRFLHLYDMQAYSPPAIITCRKGKVKREKGKVPLIEHIIFIASLIIGIGVIGLLVVRDLCKGEGEK